MQHYRCFSATHLAHSCKYINAICNTCKKRGHLDKICENNNFKKQLYILNTVIILSLSYDKGTFPIKIPVLIENRAITDMELDTGSSISAIPTKRFRRVFLNQIMFLNGIQLTAYNKRK